MISDIDKLNCDYQSGSVLLIDKAYGWTSFDVVNRIRSYLKRKYNYKKIKVGHAGTLDPLATGLLIVCTGNKTKEITAFQSLEKEYVATIRFGATTPSFDSETDIDKKYLYNHIKEESFKQNLYKFVGRIRQVPPLYSAKKVRGERAYKLARKGKEVVLEPVEVEIFNIEILEYKMPVVRLLIVCSKGTYIRSLARDLGFAMESGAHLTALQRTRIGEYMLKDAIKIDE